MSKFKKAYQREPASVPTPSPGEVPSTSYWLKDHHLRKDHDKLKKSPDAVPSFPKGKKGEEKQAGSEDKEAP